MEAFRLPGDFQTLDRPGFFHQVFCDLAHVIQMAAGVNMPGIGCHGSMFSIVKNKILIYNLTCEG